MTDVERDGYRKPERLTFASFAREWVIAYPEAKGLKQSTRRGYRGIVEGHLISAFETSELQNVAVERVGRYLADKRKAGLSAATMNRHLNGLSLVGRFLQAATRI